MTAATHPFLLRRTPAAPRAPRWCGRGAGELPRNLPARRRPGVPLDRDRRPSHHRRPRGGLPRRDPGPHDGRHGAVVRGSPGPRQVDRADRRPAPRSPSPTHWRAGRRCGSTSTSKPTTQWSPSCAPCPRRTPGTGSARRPSPAGGCTGCEDWQGPGWPRRWGRSRSLGWCSVTPAAFRACARPGPPPDLGRPGGDTRRSCSGPTAAGCRCTCGPSTIVRAMVELLDLGVDGIVTDRPTVLRDVLIERGSWG